MKALLFVTILLIGAFADQGSQGNGVVTAFLEKVNSTPFGETLWGTIELELQNGAPGDYLLELLNKMKSTVEEDLNTGRKSHEIYQGNCKKELGSFKKEIKNHAQAVVESRDIIKKANQKMTFDTIERETEQRQLKEAQEGLAKIDGIRAKEAEVYEKKINELNDALLVLHQGKSLLEKNLMKGASFVEITNGLNSYVRKMESLVQQPDYNGRGYVSMIAFISELLQNPAVQASQESVRKVVGMIQSIIDELERAKNVEFKAEQERISNFNQLKAIYEKSITDLTNNIEKLGNEINSLKQIIDYNQRRIKENTKSIVVKKRQEMKLKKECKAEDLAFKKEDKKRQADLDLVTQALALIQEHIDEFRKIVLQRAEAGISGKFGSTSSEAASRQ